MKIMKVIGREVLDSRGNPTVEADVHLENGFWGRATVPSGASVGTHEAHELRDGDKKRYEGLGVIKAVANINDIIAHDLVGLPVEDQRSLDNRLIKLDGTSNKEHLGANAILAVSVAMVKAAADAAGQPVYRYLGTEQAHTMPVPLFNIMNGGRHALDSIDFQECMIAPIGADTFHEAMQMGMEVYRVLKGLLKDKGLSTEVGDEGGFGLTQSTNEQALQLMVQAIEKASYRPGEDCVIALDPAASEFYQDGFYNMSRENKKLNSADMMTYYDDLLKKFPIFSIEDPFFEDDWPTWQAFTAKHGSTLQIVGDDLFVTNQSRLQQGIDQRSANAILVKPNQIGTVSETIDTVRLAQANHFATIISHRSGETVDPFIADLDVALGCGQIKTGAPARSERTAKYNQLLRIEEWLGADARFPSLT